MTTVTEILILIAMIGYAVYLQTQRYEVVGSSRFRLAIVYAAVGLAIGGLVLPAGPAEWALLAANLGLSVVVGVARGRLTRVWVDETTGRVYRQGTALTVGLFLGMIAVKFGLGTYAYFAHLSNTGGFGEVLVMIAVMVAIQAELVWRRGRVLGARTSARRPAAAPATR